MLSSNCRPETETRLRRMFKDTEYIERRGFNVLHKIVLGLVYKDLEDELQASTAALNDVDSKGRTALSLASGKGDIDHVRVCLRYGADPDICSYSRHSPLHFAVRAAAWACVRCLLEHGASVELATLWQQTALHYAAAYQDDTRCVVDLVRAGAEVDARDRDGITPLGWAAISGRPGIAAALLNHGAALENRSSAGTTALFESVGSNRHVVLRLLLRRGAPRRPLLRPLRQRQHPPAPRRRPSRPAYHAHPRRPRPARPIRPSPRRPRPDRSRRLLSARGRGRRAQPCV